MSGKMPDNAHHPSPTASLRRQHFEFRTVTTPFDPAGYTHIVVGGGTAGCIVASRLSERAANRVLLVEAGPDFQPGSEPATVADAYPRSYGDPRFFWTGLPAKVGAQAVAGGAALERLYEQARIMGGGSSIHGMVALRGMPGDYDEWRDLGCEGWGWNDVLPYFKRLERDLDCGGPLHGTSGPIPIRRQKQDMWGPFASAVASVWRQQGYADHDDANGVFEDGVYPVPMSNTTAGRVSSAMGYLTRDVRARANLTVVGDARIRRILFDGMRADGVEVVHAGQAHRVTGRNVILSAGGIHSPAILLKSGVGCAQRSREMDIPVVADLPAVGQNLLNHPLLYIATHLKHGARQHASVHAWGQAWLRYSSGMPGCPPGDMAMFVVNKSSWHPLGKRTGAISVSPYKSFSRGTVTLRGADPDLSPDIDFQLLSDERDLRRMADGLGACFRTFADASLDAYRNEVFLPPGAMVKRLNRPGFGSWVTSAAIERALAMPDFVRSALLKGSRLDVGTLGHDPAALRELAIKHTGPAGHVAGTCRLGPSDAPTTVVDPDCRVRGVANVRVIDGSIMPTMVRANTNLPITMVAERAVDRVLAEA